MLRHLRHPNVVEPAPSQALDTLRTVRVRGDDLAARPPTTVVEAVRTLAQVSRIVAEFHSLGWAHGAIDPAHLIRSDGGTIVVCSWRRATQVSRDDSPAALADTATIVAVGRRWSALPAITARDRALMRRFARILDAAGPTTTAGQLATHLANLAEDARQVATARHRRARRPIRPARTTTPRRRHARPRSPLRGLAMRTAICLGVAVWLGTTRLHAASIDSADFHAALPVQLLVWATTAFAAYGAVLNGVTLVAHCSRSRRIEGWSRRIGPSWLRRWVTGIAVAGVAGTALAPAPPTGQTPATVSVELPRLAESTATTTSTTLAPSPTVAPSPSFVPQPERAAPGAATMTYTLRPGDHLWSVAERAVAMALGRPATAAQVAPYWRRLIRENRHILVEPTSPDLVFAGQVVTLPALGSLDERANP